jgi:hypothetical protein
MNYYRYGLVCCVAWLLAYGKLRAQDVAQMVRSKPVRVNGSIDARMQFYSSTGASYGYLPFNYIISGNPVLTLYGYQVPFSFIIGKQQSGVGQPFNQFGLSPTYKWITLHLGYRNLTYSPFTLGGYCFFGAGVDLRPGKFRLSAMYGRFNKASILDTAAGLSVNNFSYTRKGWAAKIGYGGEQNFVELIALRAGDDSSSLKSLSKAMADSFGIAPAQNMVLGANTRLTFFKKLVWEAQAAFSLYTNDLRSLPLDSLGIEQKWKDLAGKAPIAVNASSEYYTALQTSLQYRSRQFSLRLQYQRVDPGYQSMGAYFLNNDYQNITIAPSFMALKNKLRFSGSLGFQQDDLKEIKRASSKKVIAAANLSADLTQRLGIDASFNNYSINQTIKALRLADSLKVVQNNMNVSVTPRYMINSTAHTHMILLNASLNTVKELNPERISEQVGDITTQLYYLTYQLGFNAAALSTYVTFNYAYNKGPQLQDKNYGATVGASKSFLKDQLSVSLNNSIIINDRNESSGLIVNESLQTNYRFFKKHSISGLLYYNNNQPKNASPLFPQFSEWRGELGYHFSF